MAQSLITWMLPSLVAVPDKLGLQTCDHDNHGHGLNKILNPHLALSSCCEKYRHNLMIDQSIGRPSADWQRVCITPVHKQIALEATVCSTASFAYAGLHAGELRKVYFKGMLLLLLLV